MNVLQQIYDELAAGALTAGDAISALLEYGFVYQGAPVGAPVLAYIQSLISGGANPMAAGISAVPPVPTVTEAAGLGSCGTSSGNKGICCAAVTQLGLARAAQGFQYTNCKGKVVCLACGTKASTSKKHPGATVFAVKRVSCGPSGCPALGSQQGTIIAPI